MKNRHTTHLILVGLFVLFASFILVTVYARADSMPNFLSGDENPNPDLHPSLTMETRLPIKFPSGDWPDYAQGNIFLNPDPPMPGSPVEICAEVINDTASAFIATLHFGAAPIGIGLPYSSIGTQEILVPAGGNAFGCIMWVYPESGVHGFEVLLYEDDSPEPLRSQRNIDAVEPLQPGVSHQLTFPVGNPIQETATISLGILPHLAGWGIELSQDVLLDMAPGEVRPVTLTVTPPAGEPLPPDNTPVVDVEAYIQAELIGGFRKIFRPPINIHPPMDPFYAESEISIYPYPPLAGEPTEICVELRNPTPYPQDVAVQFSWASFGIGLPFTHIDGLRPVHLPPHSIVKECIHWVPPVSGNLCLQVSLSAEGYQPQFSQRNLDVGEPLKPGIPHQLIFPVSNPTQETATISLGIIPHLPGWGVELSQDILLDMAPGEVRPVTLTVTPPAEVELGSGEPIVDVEAYIKGKPIGGFHKLDTPPIPIHRPHEKIYSESEIIIVPYPPKKGETTTVSAELYNISDAEATVELEFGWANFGMGIPFSSEGMVPSKRTVTLGPHATTILSIKWTPKISGHQCVILHVTDPEGIYAPQYSQRNVDIIENPPCGTMVYAFNIRNSTSQPVIVDLGLIKFNVPPDWEVSTVPSGSVAMQPFEVIKIEVHVTIPCPSPNQTMHNAQRINALLGESEEMAMIDVEGYVNGEFLGGIELRFTFEPHYPFFLPFISK